MEIREFDIKSYRNEPIMIYGTTVGGKMIFQCLQKEGIQVTCFIDRRIVKDKFCGISVKEPEVLKEKKGILLIAVTRSYVSVCQFLDEIQFDRAYSCVNLIGGKSAEDFLCEKDEKVGVSDFLVKYPLYVKRFKEEKMVLPSLEIFITERCTLRCRDCSHLVKYYDHPKDYEMESIIAYLDNFLSVIDYLEEIIILGGEPLLHPELPKLIEHCKNTGKIRDITIISNGTVVPGRSVLEVMRQTKARLRLSDYGELSRNIADARRVCKEYGVECFVLHELWTNMGEIYKHDYDRNEMKRMFADCPFAFSILLLRGKLFRCVHVAHLNNLKKIHSKEHDCVDFTDFSKKDVVLKRQELQKYLDIDYLEGCQYCNGFNNGVHGIEAAIQEEH